MKHPAGALMFFREMQKLSLPLNSSSSISVVVSFIDLGTCKLWFATTMTSWTMMGCAFFASRIVFMAESKRSCLENVSPESLWR